MRLKGTVLFVGGGLLVATLAPAYAELAPSVTGTVVSQYVFRGVRLAGPSVQPAIEFGDANTSFGLSASTPLEREARDLFDVEADIFASRRFAVNARTGIRPGVVAYVYGGAAAGWRRSAIEPSLALDYTLGPVQVTPALSYDLTNKEPTFEITGAMALPLSRFGTELDLTANIGTRRLRRAQSGSTPGTNRARHFSIFEASVPWQVTPRSRVTIGLAYVVGEGSAQIAGTRFPNLHQFVGRLDYTFRW